MVLELYPGYGKVFRGFKESIPSIRTDFLLLKMRLRHGFLGSSISKNTLEITCKTPLLHIASCEYWIIFLPQDKLKTCSEMISPPFVKIWRKKGDKEKMAEMLWQVSGKKTWRKLWKSRLNYVSMLIYGSDGDTYHNSAEEASATTLSRLFHGSRGGRHQNS